jgi:hypothetical protein
MTRLLILAALEHVREYVRLGEHLQAAVILTTVAGELVRLSERERRLDSFRGAA